MKTVLHPLLAAFSLAAAAQAGMPVSDTVPAPSSDLWQWFAGGSVGHLTELDEEIFSLHAGVEKGAHAYYLQMGCAPALGADFETPAMQLGYRGNDSIKLDVIPVTLNYKYQGNLAGNFNYYVGLGLGAAVLDLSTDSSWFATTNPPTSGEYHSDSTKLRIYGEIFAGLTYDIGESFEVFAGARYIFMDNYNWQAVFTNAEYSAGIDENVLLELGARYFF